MKKRRHGAKKAEGTVPYGGYEAAPYGALPENKKEKKKKKGRPPGGGMSLERWLPMPCSNMIREVPGSRQTARFGIAFDCVQPTSTHSGTLACLLAYLGGTVWYCMYGTSRGCTVLHHIVLVAVTKIKGVLVLCLTARKRFQSYQGTYRADSTTP